MGTGTGTAMGVLSKRQSDAEKVLQLLKDPFHTQVCLSIDFFRPPTPISYLTATLRIVITKIRLRQFRHIDRIYAAPRDRILLPPPI
jgi:hypothetical protein